MPRILHVISGLGVGGAEMTLYRLVLHSRGSAYHHRVVSLTPGDGMRSRFLEAGVAPEFFDFKRAPLREFLRLMALIRQYRPDIVQTWMYHADLFGGLAARMAGIRHVIWGIRTTNAAAGGSRSIALVRKICAYLSRRVPCAIVCAAQAARRAHIEAGYDEKRMRVIPNGFDMSSFAVCEERRKALRAQCGFTDAHVVVGSVGRFNRAKDQENFVRAAGLLSRMNEHVRFLMVGRGINRDNPVLAQWIRASGCGERFVLLDERKDVPVCLSAMDVFCLSSRTEGFPNVVAEAMAMRLACVVTDVGDAAVLLGECGVVVPKEDHAALAEGLRQVVAMPPGERADLGRAAMERVRTEFTVERARRRFEDMYEEVLGGVKR